MMTCWQCGAALPPDVGFCRGCGAFVRPRSMPGNRYGATAPHAPQTPSTPSADDTAAQASTPSAAGFGPRPPFAVGSTPASEGKPGSASRPPYGVAAPAASRPTAPTTLSATPSGSRAGIASSGVDSDSTLADVLAGLGAGFVLISMLLTWYRVTITPLGVEFFESLERALFSRLFPQFSAGLGGLSGPLTMSLSPLDKAAGGWRWAILVVSIVILLEVLLDVSSGAAKSLTLTWPHTAVLLVLTVANLLLVVAAFVALPYGATPAGYLIVARGVGAYLGLAASFVACGGVVAALVKNSSSGDSRPPGGLR